MKDSNKSYRQICGWIIVALMLLGLAMCVRGDKDREQTNRAFDYHQSEGRNSTEVDGYWIIK